jgi:general secretion pathway protein E
MARLDIAEKRLPQDGRITLRIGGRAVDVRVSTMPTNHGERAVLRLLDKQSARLDLTALGMDAKALELFIQLIKKPHGILLVTGPTGSGKTTTLYSGLIILNDKKRNILTVEDPIEYDLPGVGQTPVNNKIQMTFAKGLRAILRQDPDVVMVGEIRDLETAQIAIQASLTGHLVLSTLHTNSAIGAITRLGDMGVEPFLLASSLVGVLAQRLMRLLCDDCKKPMLATTKECELLGVSESESPVIYHPVGCSNCRHTGYSGRSGVYELIAIDEPLRTMIHDRSPEQQMRHYARSLYPSLRQDGFRRVLEGETSLEEILRVTGED